LLDELPMPASITFSAPQPFVLSGLRIRFTPDRPFDFAGIRIGHALKWRTGQNHCSIDVASAYKSLVRTHLRCRCESADYPKSRFVTMCWTPPARGLLYGMYAYIAPGAMFACDEPGCVSGTMPGPRRECRGGITAVFCFL